MILPPQSGIRVTWSLTNLLLLLLLIALAVDISVRILALAYEPCEGHVIVPRAFVWQYPQCAQKLIETADLDNFEIVSPEDYVSHDAYGSSNVSVNSSGYTTDWNTYVPPPQTLSTSASSFENDTKRKTL